MPFVRHDSHGAVTLEPIFYAQGALAVGVGTAVELRWGAAGWAVAAGLGVFALLTAFLFHTATRWLSASLGTLMGTGGGVLAGRLLAGNTLWGAGLGGIVGLTLMLGCYRSLFRVHRAD